MGPSGSETAMKLVVNDMLGIEMVALSEAAIHKIHVSLSKSTQETYALANGKTPDEDFSSVIKVIKQDAS